VVGRRVVRRRFGMPEDALASRVVRLRYCIAWDYEYTAWFAYSDDNDRNNSRLGM
jgi:hypothetical protein